MTLPAKAEAGQYLKYILLKVIKKMLIALNYLFIFNDKKP